MSLSVSDPVIKSENPSDTAKLHRLLELQEAASGASLLDDNEVAPYLQVIRSALKEALHEINNVSASTEGKRSCDPWFYQLLFQARMALCYVETRGHERVSRNLNSMMYAGQVKV